jgi:hypothetical protein
MRHPFPDFVVEQQTNDYWEEYLQTKLKNRVADVEAHGCFFEYPAH